MLLGTNIVTETKDNTFKVSILSNKDAERLFEYVFTVYSNFDKKGLIDDAIFMFKRKNK